MFTQIIELLVSLYETGETTCYSLLASADSNNLHKPTHTESKPSYGAVMKLANTIEIPDDYFEKMTYLERARAEDIEDACRLGLPTDDEFIENKTF